MQYYVSNSSEKFSLSKVKGKKKLFPGFKEIKLYPNIKDQEIIGFGGALTESSAYVFSKMDKANQDRLLNLYFSQAGNKYNLARLQIQSSDFALKSRAYVKAFDSSLKSFDLGQDYDYIIPFVKAAQGINSEIEFLASPWSPPGFMKTNFMMNLGGKLKEKYYPHWAELMLKYLQAYKAEGIDIKRITVQNEPEARQLWDSCLYTATEEARFATDYLRPTLDKAGFEDVKIFIWDHNKDVIIERVEESFAYPGAKEAIDGIAFHWYTGDHFAALDYVNRKYNDKELIFTEGCVGYDRTFSKQVQHAETYAHDIIGNLNAGMQAFIDWNVLLDAHGGPNHKGNFCEAPVMYNLKTKELKINLSYYYIAHFSRFIDKGARRILSSSYDSTLETTAFINQDNSIAVVILNRSAQTKDFSLKLNEQVFELKIQPHSIMTGLIKENEYKES